MKRLCLWFCKIFPKLIGSFCVVAIILAVVGAMGWYGIDRTADGLRRVSQVRLPSIRGIGLMMEGLVEIKAAERTLVNSSLTVSERRREVEELDEPWREFNEGLALYEPLEKTADEEELLRRFQDVFEEWRVEHRKLVDLAGGVKLNDPAGLKTQLVARRLDHIKWVGDLDVAIAESREFAGQLDPTRCGLGKWLAGFDSGSKEFDALLDRFDAPHKKLHELGEQINEMIFMHNFTSMGESVEARQLFDSEVEPTLAAIESLFDEALEETQAELDRLHRALDIAFGSEAEAYGRTANLLYKLTGVSSDLADEVRRSAATTAVRSKLTALVAMIAGIVLALGFGFFIARSIAVPLKNAVRIIGKIAVGDTSERMQVGQPVNCSSIKKCGHSECPSYGRVDTCWVTSGSFAAVKHCPRAKKGEDCRSCELYGARDELEELGSIIAALSDNVEDRENLAMSVANGDLTRQIEIASEKDDLGKALQLMVRNLAGIIGQVKRAAGQIADGSSQISDTSQSLAQGATEQASSVEEISASMTQMNAQTGQNAENARQASQLAEEAKTAAGKGNAQMAEMIMAMEEINEASQNISKIIKVIDEIAFQTNLLALNAAVEAARAGQHGKGFAVVAEEVRNLAARSAKAARETAELIEGAVTTTGKGTETANQTADALGEIVRGVTKVSDLIAEIAAASKEQATGISEVNEGLSQIDKVTQQNTANAEEAAASAEELSAQATELRSMLTSFKLRSAGENSEAEPLPAPADEQWGGKTNNRSARPEDIIALGEDSSATG